MVGGTMTGKAFDLDAALARLAEEAGPSPALTARVLADAAMVSAERCPAPAPARGAGSSRAGWRARMGRMDGRLHGRQGRHGRIDGWWGLGLGGVAATLAVGLALGIGGTGTGGLDATGDLASRDGTVGEVAAGEGSAGTEPLVLASGTGDPSAAAQAAPAAPAGGGGIVLAGGGSEIALAPALPVSDETLLTRFSALDDFERDMMAVVDEELFEVDGSL